MKSIVIIFSALFFSGFLIDVQEAFSTEKAKEILTGVVRAMAKIGKMWYKGRHWQSVAVQGTLLCNGKPAGGAEVKLVDVHWLWADEILNQGHTNTDGSFFLFGSVNKFMELDAKLNIDHQCDGAQTCQRVSIRIPDDLITAGQIPDKWYSLSYFELMDKKQKSCK